VVLPTLPGAAAFAKVGETREKLSPRAMRAEVLENFFINTPYPL
jgi:hypothetical protein